jgi:hypothetical protein
MYLGKRFLILLPGAVFGAAVAMAQVAPTSIFQLDGNAAQSAGYPPCTYGTTAPGACDYWNLLNGTGVGTNPGAPGHSLVRTFVSGTSSTDSFTGGGSKDSNLLSQWAYSATPTPNKDTLNGAYAAAYSQNGDFLVTFGADRASPNGDANIGIWFFQQQVGINGSGGFTGAHMDHDIFLISAFTGGGGNSTIEALEWDHTCLSGVKNPTANQCADTNLRLLANVGLANVCGSSAYCAITNSSATNTSWEGTLASPLFFEGGVDITYALSQANITNLPCFSSFLVETRSSQSTTAVLKDFLGGGFPVCGMSITKSCGTATVNSGGTAINYPVGGMVTNTGIGTLYNVTVFDTVGSTTNHVAVTPSTLAAGAQGTWSDSSSSSALSQSDSALAQAATTSGGPLIVTSGNTAVATCTYTPTSMLTVSKSCTTTLAPINGAVSVQVAFSGQVCNTGQSQITGITLVDYPSTSSTAAAVANIPTLAPAACTPYTGTYTPTGIDTAVNGGTGPGRYFFNDLVTITAAKSTLGTLTPITSTDARANGTYGYATASCPICQGSGECTTP